MSDDDGLKDWIRELNDDSADEELKNYLKEDKRDLDDFTGFQSKDYQQYLEEEKYSRTKSKYERIVDRTTFFRFVFDDMVEEHKESIDLLNWDLEADQIGPSALVIAALFLPIALLGLIIPMPNAFRAVFLFFPFVVFGYLVKYPKLRAQRKIVNSSEGLILSVLYMVVYMRHSPNLEGAVAFAAQKLDGPIGRDLNRVMWELDMRVHNNIEDALQSYMEKWKPYNEGFVEAISLLKSSISAPSDEKRKEILNEAVETLLEYTRKQMNEFARNLKMPVMVLHGIGILLPVLGIILFPLVANFMGGENLGIYLTFLYNFLLPAVVYFTMRTLLTSRPLSFSSASGQTENMGPQIDIEIRGTTYTISMFYISVPLFFLFAAWPAMHYFKLATGQISWPANPGNMVLLQEMMFMTAVAVPIGVHYVYGYQKQISLQEKVTAVEEEFPKALFELGNALEKGQPIERAVDDAAEGASELDISEMFRIISYNIKQYGLTFQQAVFDDRRGALQEFNSQLIGTIMEIIAESTRKGTRTAAASILSIAEYLTNIQETQEKLEEMMSDTLSSVKFLGYVLAPVISGVAVGMGVVISQAFYTIGQVFSGATNGSTGVGAGAGNAPGAAGTTGLLDIFQVDSALPPGVLQLVVGIYILQISYLIGMLSTRLEYGKNEARRKSTVGKIYISATIMYQIVVFIIVAVFGSIIGGIGG